MRRRLAAPRPVEGLALILVTVFSLLVFFSASAGLQVRQGESPLANLPGALLPPLGVMISFGFFHHFLCFNRFRSEQIILPVISLLLMVGLVMIYRLLGPAGAWQQILRGFLPGLLAAGVLVAHPAWIERIRRWAIPICLGGLALPILTGLFGTVDETGARLALKLGPLPAIQTSEMLKLAMIIFLAWFIERQKRATDGHTSILFNWMRRAALRYFITAVLFVGLSTLALVVMADYGAVLILGCIFMAMLYAGFTKRTFLMIVGTGFTLAVIVVLILAFTWKIPPIIQYRFKAYQDPWSQEIMVVNGQSTGVSIAEGPGYQIQQAIYAVVAGGISGSGLGFGSPDYVPLAHSDFILAAIIEEMGAIIAIAVLFLFGVLLLRIFRAVFLLPPDQVFERLLLVGIGVHLFTQVFIMAGGTLNLLPMTGVTIPFLSLGGAALFTNLVEIGIVMALVRRQERANLDV